MTSVDEDCSLSWNGFNLHGNRKSINEAKRLVERNASLELEAVQAVQISPSMNATAIVLDALENIALAGMSPAPEMSQDGVDAWHARQAWNFIGIAARALEPLRAAIKEEAVQPAGTQKMALDALKRCLRLVTPAPNIVKGSLYEQLSAAVAALEAVQVVISLRS